MKRKKNIIIVEDDKTWSILLEKTLANSKLKDIINITIFCSYEDASDWFIKNDDYDLVIIDLELNEGNRAGIKFSKYLKFQIIVVSGDIDTSE